MIIAAVCVGCKTGHSDFHPVGWTRVRVGVTTRTPDENEKMVLHPQQRIFFFCEKCFEPWWNSEEQKSV